MNPGEEEDLGGCTDPEQNVSPGNNMDPGEHLRGEWTRTDN